MDTSEQTTVIERLVVSIYAVWRDERTQTATSITGTAVLLYLAYHTIMTLWFWIKPGSIQIYCHAETGSWALVTGASDGIGYAFSDDLLKRGFNVLLHGRNAKKLDGVRQKLAQKYPRRSVDVVVADASKVDEGYKVVAEKVKKLPGKLTILVNNVGGVCTHPQYVPHAEMAHEDIDTLLNVNLRFPTQLTAALLPTLKANVPSAILNCGSIGGMMAMPYIVTYASTKAYIRHFTESLRAEMIAEGTTGVEVMGWSIGNVESNSNRAKMAGTATSEECAIASLDRVGCGRGFTFPRWLDFVQATGAQMLPERVVRKITVSEMSNRRIAEQKSL